MRIPLEAYSDGPDGLKIYEVKLGDGPLAEVRTGAQGIARALGTTRGFIRRLGSFTSSALDE